MKSRIIIRVLIALIIMIVFPFNLLASYPSDPSSDTEWPDSSESSVSQIQTRFNTARTNENSQLGTSVPMLTLPSQTEWNSKDDGEKALWLINRERIDRGVDPLDSIETNVTSIAQYYAQYLLDNDAFAHDADGNSPQNRLNTNSAINACHDFLSVAENLAVLWGGWTLPIERSVYMWMYDDSGSNWGHRHAILWYPYNDNSGSSGKEGFFGIGRATGTHNGYSNSDIIVMNIFDPCSSWVYDGGGGSEISSPVPESTLSSSTVTFTWNNTNADQYWLWIGTSPEGYDVYSANRGTTTSATVSDLPGSQETLYVRLFSKYDGEWSHNDYTYTACNMKAGIQSPASASTLSSATQTFTWNNSGASGYWLWIGTSAGDYDIYSGNLGTDTSVTITELPANGEALYVRLFSRVNGAWVYDTDYTYTACDKMAEIQSPTPESPLSSATQTFTWNNSGADGYWLWIGTSAGGYDLYSGNVGTNTSVSVSELPANGETLYVRLWSKVDGIWIYNTDNTYTACALIAAIQSPASGSALDSTTETFTWNNTGADGYWLWIGTSAGAYDVYSGNLGTNTSVAVSDLPNGGGTLYVRLWSKVDGIWIYNTDCTYTTTVLAAIQSPGSGSVLGSTTVTFSWNNAGASGYWLWIGTSEGGYDVYSSGDLGTSTSTVASGLPNSGETLYARLWSKVAGTWIYNTDFTYTAVSGR